MVVLVTCPEKSAERIATEVLKLRLAACVNIVNGVHSHYRWKGRLDSANESLLVIKTRSNLFGKLERAVKRIHPYEVPEIIGVRIERSGRDYLDWIARETGPIAKSTKRH